MNKNNGNFKVIQSAYSVIKKLCLNMLLKRDSPVFLNVGNKNDF